MQRYDVKVRLAGSVGNEVLKSNVTAAEVILLRRLHGEDAVAVVHKNGKPDKTPHQKERAMLKAKYCTGGGKEHRTKFSFEGIFGAEGTPLPLELPEPVDEQPEPVVDVDDIAS